MGRRKKTRRKSEQSVPNEQLKKSIIKTRNAIRKKFRDLHNQKVLLGEKVSETYKPIIEPLQTLVKQKNEKIKKEEEFATVEKKIEGKKHSPDDFKTAFAPHRRNLFDAYSKNYSSAGSTGSQNKNENNVSGIAPFPTSLAEIDSENESDSSSNFKEEAIIKKVQSNLPYIDDTYGFRVNHGELRLGKQPILIKTIDGENYFHVKRSNFKITHGLSKLLLMKTPKHYTKEDLKNYKKMLELTNAHKYNYLSGASVRRDASSSKYNNIISMLFPLTPSSRFTKETRNIRKKLGTSLQNKTENNFKLANRVGCINYTYWDDPNELVDRLRLLKASQDAGHTGHDNEIISILEELREANIIE